MVPIGIFNTRILAMRARGNAWLAIVLCLAACSSKHTERTTKSADTPAAQSAWFAGAPRQGAGMHLAYKHSIGIEVARASLRRHFVAARDRCINEAALHCVLLSASSNGTGMERDAAEESRASASLHLRLPHDFIVPFVNALTSPLPGEPPGVAQVRQQSTTAEDLGQPIADVQRRLAQLTDYRDRLQTLEKRPDIHVDDLIKIAGEMSQVQTQLEAADAEKHELAERVDTEELDIAFDEPVREGAFEAVRMAWARGAETFSFSMATAIEFSIAAIPWLPLLALLMLTARAARRFVFGGVRARDVSGADR
jgi:hypothetical protein